MDLKGVTTSSILALLAVLLLVHSANTTGAQNLKQSVQTASASEPQWLAATPVERIDKMQAPPPPHAVLEIHHVKFDPKWVKLEVGVPIGIYVSFKNTGSPGSITTDFRIYLSQDGKVLQKGRPSSNRLQAGRASFTKFQITLPDKPGRYCWEVSLRQTDDGRMTLGEPRNICALLKTKPVSVPMHRRP